MFLFRNKASLFSLKLVVNIWEQRNLSHQQFQSLG